MHLITVVELDGAPADRETTAGRRLLGGGRVESGGPSGGPAGATPGSEAFFRGLPRARLVVAVTTTAAAAAGRDCGQKYNTFNIQR